jgi:hypothetical protein
MIGGGKRRKEVIGGGKDDWRMMMREGRESESKWREKWLEGVGEGEGTTSVQIH